MGAKKLKACVVFCADSGILHCEKLGVKTDPLAGDFNSAGFFSDKLAEDDAETAIKNKYYS